MRKRQRLRTFVAWIRDKRVQVVAFELPENFTAGRRSLPCELVVQDRRPRNEVKLLGVCEPVARDHDYPALIKAPEYAAVCADP